MVKTRYTKKAKDALAEKYGTNVNNIGMIISWNNQIFDGKQSMDNLRWIADNEKKITKHYQDLTLAGKYKCLRKVYSTLTVYYKKINVNPVKAKEYASLNKTMSFAENIKQENQKLREDEHYLPFEDVVNLRRAFLVSWRQNPDNKELNIKALILALNTYQAPLRSETKDMPMYAGGRPRGLRNVDYIFKRDGKWHYFIGKVIKGQSEINFEIPLKKKLSHIIDESIEYFPRKYLLTSWGAKSKGDKPIAAQYGRFLSSIGLGVSALRKSFVTKYYNDRPNITLAEKSTLAHLMRHDVATQEKYYMKQIDNAQPQIEKHTERLNRERVSIENVESEREQKEEKHQVALVEPRHKPGPVAKFDSVSEYMKAYRMRNYAKVRAQAKVNYDKNSTKQKAYTYASKLNMEPGNKYRISKANPKFVELYKLEKVDGKWKTNL